MITLRILYAGGERTVYMEDPPIAEMNKTREEAVYEFFKGITELDSIWVTDALSGLPVFMRCRDFQHIDVKFDDTVPQRPTLTPVDPAPPAAA